MFFISTVSRATTHGELNIASRVRKALYALRYQMLSLLKLNKLLTGMFLVVAFPLFKLFSAFYREIHLQEIRECSVFPNCSVLAAVWMSCATFACSVVNALVCVCVCICVSSV